MSVDLATRYLGLELRTPLVAAASPMTAELDLLAALEAHGAGAVVLPSIFEEQLDADAMAIHGALGGGAEVFPEAAEGYLPEVDDYATGPEPYLRRVEAARARLSIPVIASLNGSTRGGWVGFARSLESAGASALELNLYHVPTDPAVSGADLEARYLDTFRAVRDAVRIPLAVKLTPFFSSLPHMARQLVGAGADGLVLFNRFVQPDIDLEDLEVVASHRLSTADELLLRIRWIAILRGQLRISLAASGGVHRRGDVVKALLAGADAVQLAAALLERGPPYLASLLEGLRGWLAEREYTSVEQMRGSLSQASCPEPAAFERAQYIRALLSTRREVSRGRTHFW